jgi:hypothetical protein
LTCPDVDRTYDAAKTLQALGARLRDEVNLGVLRETLLSVVQETLQLEYESLWPCHPWTRR